MDSRPVDARAREAERRSSLAEPQEHAQDGHASKKSSRTARATVKQHHDITMQCFFLKFSSARKGLKRLLKPYNLQLGGDPTPFCCVIIKKLYKIIIIIITGAIAIIDLISVVMR